MTDEHAGSVVVVDDDPYVLESLVLLLRMHSFAVRGFADGAEALASMRREPADVVVSDINMPGMNGLKLLEFLRRDDQETPVIFISGNPTMDSALAAVRLQAIEFLCKPATPAELLAAIYRGIGQKRRSFRDRNYLAELEQSVVVRTSELAASLDAHRHISREVIQTLTRAAEMRDEDTGAHISRIGAYAGRIAEELGMDSSFVETVTLASAMHDIGKIAIPDAILFKPGPLTPQEFEAIKTHTIIGEEILRDSTHPVLKMAAGIALSHHERWDGSGYPYGLKGESIPLPGRIVILADQYDALRSRRPYKLPFDHDTTIRIITEGDGKTMPNHFDPAILNVCHRIADSLAEIYEVVKDGTLPWNAMEGERKYLHAHLRC